MRTLPTWTIACRSDVSTKMSESSLLQNFWSLSSLVEEERIQAARDLLSSLNVHQSQHSGEGLCSELQYSVKRLVRGLASNRKAARHGYFIALTELLVQFRQVQLSEMFELIHTHLESSGGIKGLEERGIYFGRVFALLSLLRSGRLETTADALKVLKQIHMCGQKKFFLQELCAVTVGQLVGECGFSDDVIKDDVIPLVGVSSGWEGCTPERLYLVLLLGKEFGKKKWFKEMLKSKWNSKHICSHVNFSQLASILQGSSSSYPRLHSVWPLVLEAVRGKGRLGEFWKLAIDDSLFTSSHERKGVGLKLLGMIISSLSVSEVPLVFSANLLRCLINNASSEENHLYPAARELLSELTSFLQSSMDQSLSISLMLYLQRRTGGKFDQLTKSNVIETVLSRLDKAGVELLVDKLQDKFCHPSTAVTDEDSDEDGAGGAHSVQLWVLEQLLSVVRNPRLPRSESWLISISRFLLLHSYFSVAAQMEQLAEFKVQAIEVSLEKLVVDNCQLKFVSVLSDLSGLSLRQGEPEAAVASVEGERGRRERFGAPGSMKDGRFFLTEVLKFATSMLSGAGCSVTHLQPFTQDRVSQVWETVCEAVETLSEKEDLSAEDRAFLLLYSNLGLQLLSPSEREKTAQTIEEVKVCYSEMELAVGKKRKTPKKKKKKTKVGSMEEGEESEPPGWIEVLTDLLLGFLSQPSQLWRNVTEQVFKLVSGHVTMASLKLILDVLEPKTSKDELMEEEEEEEGEGEDEGEEEEEGEGEEEEEGEGEGGEEIEDDASVAGEDSEIDEDDRGSDVSKDRGEEEGQIDPMFRAAVQKALGAAAVDSDAESESSLDDDAMMAIDEALAAVFRTRFTMKHHRKQKKDEAKSVLHFKLRVLDLVELYIRKESTNPLVLDLVIPLYELVHSAQSHKESAPLVKRVSGIFKNKLCHMKNYPRDGFDVEHVHSHLQQLVQRLHKVNPSTAPLVTQGFMFLLRVLRGSNAPPSISPVTTRSGRKRKREEAAAISEEKEVLKGNGLLKTELVNEWLGDALHNFITKKNSNVPPAFFITYIERYPVLASQLAPKMVDGLPLAASHFKKAQTLEMLRMLSGLLDSDLTDKLTSEDADAVVVVSTKKRKRSKHKKQKRTSDIPDHEL